MKRSLWLGAGLTALAALAPLSARMAVAQDDDDIEARILEDEREGIEILNRGPIHEAFAEPWTGDASPTLVVDVQPPEPIDEVPPAYKPEGDNVVWIPGYWAWADERDDFIWVSGIWRNVPPGQRWIPGYWAAADSGWQWVPGFWLADQDEEIVYYPTPPETLEEGPTSPSPGDDYFWVPGVWMYDVDWQWRPGYWAEYQPDWVWVPARWVWSPNGCVFTTGYWDYQPTYRGYLFAPVYFQQPVWQTAGWSYSPWFVVRTPSVFVHLWVRPNYCHYYFGNFYGRDYARYNMVSWVDWSIRQRRWDPIFAYNRVRYGLQGVNYVNRMSNWHDYFVTNTRYRPAITVRDQVTQINNLRVRGGDTTIINQINLVNSLNTVARSRDAALPFTHLERAQRHQIAERSSRLHDIAHARLQEEVHGNRGDRTAARDRGAIGRSRLPHVSLSDLTGIESAARDRTGRQTPRHPDLDRAARAGDRTADRMADRATADRAAADRAAERAVDRANRTARTVDRDVDRAGDRISDRTARENAADIARRRAAGETAADRAARAARDIGPTTGRTGTTPADRAGRVTAGRPSLEDALDRMSGRAGERTSDRVGRQTDRDFPGRPGIGSAADSARDRSGVSDRSLPGGNVEGTVERARESAQRARENAQRAAERAMDRSTDRSPIGAAPGRSSANRSSVERALDRARTSRGGGVDRSPDAGRGRTPSARPDRSDFDLRNYRSPMTAAERPSLGGGGSASPPTTSQVIDRLRQSRARLENAPGQTPRPTFGGGDDRPGGTTIRSRTPAADSSVGAATHGGEQRTTLRPPSGPFDVLPGFDRLPYTRRSAGRPAPTGLDLDRLRGADRAGGQDIPAARAAGAAGIGVGNSINTPNVGGPGRGSLGPSRTIDQGQPGSGPRAGKSALGDRPIRVPGR